MDNNKHSFEEKLPTLKYYAFDWDDNIVTMPTNIILIDDNNEEVGMSTEDFAKYRSKIGKEDFKYKNKNIKGLAKDAFRFFRTSGDKEFLIDSLLAKPGPAWKDFVECINNGSIFAIITARGHNPNTIKEAVYNYVISNFNGIDKNQLLKNLKKFRNFTDEEILSDREMIKHYLDLCKFYPVSFGQKVETNPESEKVKALETFTNYIKEIAGKIYKKAYIKNNIKNFFLPTIGFSDDDIRNVKAVKNHFENKPGNIIQTYSTANGKKVKY
jgi:hypothetical protein